jgi:hypothetical protein
MDQNSIYLNWPQVPVAYPLNCGGVRRQSFAQRTGALDGQNKVNYKLFPAKTRSFVQLLSKFQQRREISSSTISNFQKKRTIPYNENIEFTKLRKSQTLLLINGSWIILWLK